MLFESVILFLLCVFPTDFRRKNTVRQRDPQRSLNGKKENKDSCLFVGKILFQKFTSKNKSSFKKGESLFSVLVQENCFFYLRWTLFNTFPPPPHPQKIEKIKKCNPTLTWSCGDILFHSFSMVSMLYNAEHFTFPL